MVRYKGRYINWTILLYNHISGDNSFTFFGTRMFRISAIYRKTRYVFEVGWCPSPCFGHAWEQWNNSLHNKCFGRVGQDNVVIITYWLSESQNTKCWIIETNNTINLIIHNNRYAKTCSNKFENASYQVLFGFLFYLFYIYFTCTFILLFLPFFL